MTSARQSTRRVPTLDEACGLPCLTRGPAGTDHEDPNGHVGVVGHMSLYDQAGWPWMARLGMDPAAGSSSTLMDVENHLRFTAEIMVGDEVSIHSRPVDRNRRFVHAYWVLVNRTRGLVSGSLEFVSAHVDLRQRRAVPFPADIAQALDTQILQAERDWVVPLVGVMTLHSD